MTQYDAQKEKCKQIISDQESLYMTVIRGQINELDNALTAFNKISVSNGHDVTAGYINCIQGMKRIAERAAEYLEKYQSSLDSLNDAMIALAEHQQKIDDKKPSARKKKAA